jgi:hypothetical protein
MKRDVFGAFALRVSNHPGQLREGHEPGQRSQARDTAPVSADRMNECRKELEAWKWRHVEGLLLK